MAALQRYLRHSVQRDLARKMVFVAGPRQVGKTTFARGLPGGRRGYLLWDDPDDRQQILQRQLPPGSLWVFDELHKYRKWRNYLKGIYDKKTAAQRILVTGSARLDYYRFGGDSLQGRYHYFRMHPLSVAELGITRPRELGDLLTLGGYPEPFFLSSEVEAKRWSRQYRMRFAREDVSDLERVQDLGTFELLTLRLPELVGSPLSVNGLREDLQVSHKTVSKWLEVLERLYAIFRIAPFGAPNIRAVKKERKHYHFDWTLVEKQPLRFENLVAAHLLKWIHFQQDDQARDLELRFFRDVDRREVDFVVEEHRRPILFVECKWGDDDVDRGLRYLASRFPSAEAWQISATGKRDYRTPEGIRVAPAVILLKQWC
jgi:predicted AAA+ superfamily ATPase